MVSRRNRTLLSLSVFLAVWAWNVSAAAVKGETGVNVGALSNAQIEEQLQVWPWVQSHFCHSYV
jgi:zinc transporter 7